MTEAAGPIHDNVASAARTRWRLPLRQQAVVIALTSGLVAVAATVSGSPLEERLLVASSSLAMGFALLDGVRCLAGRRAGREAADHRSQVIGGLSGGVLVVNHDQVEMVNEQLVRLLGRTEADLLGHDLGELLGASGEEHFRAQRRTIMAGDQATPVRLTLPRGDSGVVDVEMKAIALGQERGALLLEFDETATPVAQERGLRESEQRFRELCRAVPAMLLIVGEDRRPLLASRALREASGYSEQELLSMRPLAALVHPEDRARMSEQASRVRRGEPADTPLRCRLLRKDGRSILVDSQLTAIDFGGGRRALLSLAIEVTDAARHGSKMIDAMTVPIGVWDRGGRLIHHNAALLELSGYSVPQLSEISPRELVIEEHRDELSAEIALSSGGTTPPARRYELAAADGRPRSVAISVTSLEFAGVQGGVLLQVADINPQLEIARRLEKLEQLEGMVASGVIHDFGNLVTAIGLRQISGLARVA